jgi:hypothetical protein
MSELEISRFLTIYGSNREIEKNLVIMENAPSRAVARRTKQGGCECKICRQKKIFGENYF